MTAPGHRGKFITLEGVDGAGKTTHLAWLAQRLRQRNLKVVVTREPGGTALGEELRRIVLGTSMHIDTETLLMFAARKEHLERVILPALAAGEWVISDRFTDATFAYQGGGRQMPPQRIGILESWVQGDFRPDLTLVFDVPPAIAANRRDGRSRSGAAAERPATPPANDGTGSTPDRFETENRVFFERVRAAYLRRAEEFPNRILLIDANRPVANIQQELEEILLTI